MSKYEHMILDCLEIEHERHAGRENGNLGKSYSQFCDYGVPRDIIGPGIDRVVAVGLLAITREGTGGRGAAHVTRFRLTYIPAKTVDDPFLKRGIELAVDGTDPEELREILDAEIISMKARHKAGAKFFSDMGAFGPTLGIVVRLVSQMKLFMLARFFLVPELGIEQL